MTERILATIAAIFTVACHPPSPPTPPHPAVPDAPSLAATEPSPVLVNEAIPPVTGDATDPLAPGTTSPAAETPDPASAAEPTGAAILIGDYAYDSGRSGVRKSIDSVTGQMNVLARGIARRRLVDANAVPKKLAIRQDGTEVTVQIDSKAYIATLGGGSRRVRDPNGEASRMRLSMRGDALYQTFHTDQGDRINVFTAREGGGLTMAVRITSGQLPDDVRYRLGFDRS